MNFKHNYYFPEKKEILCMRCADPLMTEKMRRGEFLSKYNERKITLTDEKGNEHPSVLLLCPKCVDADITVEEISDAKNQIIGALNKQKDFSGANVEAIDWNIELFNKSNLKDLKEKTVFEEKVVI